MAAYNNEPRERKEESLPLTRGSGSVSLCRSEVKSTATLERKPRQKRELLRCLFAEERAKERERHRCSLEYEYRKAQVGVLRSFISACQPYFHFLESNGRNALSCHEQLLELSQEMCDKLECLVLKFATRELVTLDDSDPENMAHFRIGHLKVKQLKLKVTSFRYCKPTPYLARVNTGIFKRMRWNVEPYDSSINTPSKYYYMCCEKIPNHADSDKLHTKDVQMWSIGQWVQVKPDPNTESIFDWVLCDVPEGAFEKLLDLGKKEPSSSKATDHLLQLLASKENISLDLSQLSDPLKYEEEMML
nr:UPF0575 protein C19orf67 homolog [Nerophis lumbriciformis]